MNSASFAERFIEPQDVPFVSDSFSRSYRVVGHVGGILDRFRDLLADPFRALVQACSREADALVAARVVYPIAEPTEIAGYVVCSPRHNALVYLLTKPAYAHRRVGAHLLSLAPTVPGDQRDERPQVLHCFSTAAFAKMAKACDVRTRYSPFMFQRLITELTEDRDV